MYQLVKDCHSEFHTLFNDVQLVCLITEIKVTQKNELKCIFTSNVWEEGFFAY